MLYRIILFLYIFSWLIVEAVTHNFKWKFFIYLTTLTNILINVDLLILTVLCIAYAAAYYCNRPMLVSHYLPEKDCWYSRDKIKWYVKVAWFLHNSATTLALMVAIGYWSLVYKCPNPTAAPPTVPASAANNTSSPGSCTDGASIHVHGVDALLLLIDIFLSRVPVQLYHLLYPCAFTFAYVVLTLIYWGAGGTNLQHEHYIYSVLDYTTKKSSTLFAVLLVIAPIVFYIVIYLLALVRDCLTRRVQWCFRDVRVHAEGNEGKEANREEEDPNVQVTKVEVTVA